LRFEFEEKTNIKCNREQTPENDSQQHGMASVVGQRFHVHRSRVDFLLPRIDASRKEKRLHQHRNHIRNANHAGQGLGGFVRLEEQIAEHKETHGENDTHDVAEQIARVELAGKRLESLVIITNHVGFGHIAHLHGKVLNRLHKPEALDIVGETTKRQSRKERIKAPRKEENDDGCQEAEEGIAEELLQVGGGHHRKTDALTLKVDVAKSLGWHHNAGQSHGKVNHAPTDEGGHREAENQRQQPQDQGQAAQDGHGDAEVAVVFPAIGGKHLAEPIEIECVVHGQYF